MFGAGGVDGGVDGDEQAERQEGRPLLMQKKSKAALLKLFFFLTLNGLKKEML